MASYIITRIGLVGDGWMWHFMADQTSVRTACGRRASTDASVTKKRAIHAVACATCWRIKHADQNALGGE